MCSHWVSRSNGNLNEDFLRTAQCYRFYKILHFYRRKRTVNALKHFSWGTHFSIFATNIWKISFCKTSRKIRKSDGVILRLTRLQLDTARLYIITLNLERVKLVNKVIKWWWHFRGKSAKRWAYLKQCAILLQFNAFSSLISLSSLKIQTVEVRKKAKLLRVQRISISNFLWQICNYFGTVW